MRCELADVVEQQTARVAVSIEQLVAKHLVARTRHPTFERERIGAMRVERRERSRRGWWIRRDNVAAVAAHVIDPLGGEVWRELSVALPSVVDVDVDDRAVVARHYTRSASRSRS